jgi:hypothetical protein
MTHKQPFPPEPDTQPDVRGSGPAQKIKRGRPAESTVPPPTKTKKSAGAETKTSGIRSRRPPPRSDAPGATVDEVTADLSRDPRRERDDDGDD